MLSGNAHLMTLRNSSVNPSEAINTNQETRAFSYEKKKSNLYINNVAEIKRKDNIKFVDYKCPIFIDIETTGLNCYEDKIITLCMVMIVTDQNHEKTMIGRHYIFDPMKKSHPRAQEVHGFDDWTVRHQEVFQERSQEIYDFLKAGTAYVAHNAVFDIPFLRKAFAESGYVLPEKPIVCTKIEAQTLGERPATLNACIARLGLSRAGKIHGADEDALLTMVVYYSHRGMIVNIPQSNIEIGNMKFVPPIPEGALPRRSNIKKNKFIKEHLSQRQLEVGS
ncbi:3'-5' exonuclease [Acetobacter sp. DmW_136]|nr:3'-5' exonuclease [Acetobacter sp. DmW_136]